MPECNVYLYSGNRIHWNCRHLPDYFSIIVTDIFLLVIFTAVTMKCSIYWDVMPWVQLKWGSCLLVSCLMYSFTLTMHLKMDVTCLSTVLGEVHWTSWWYIPKDKPFISILSHNGILTEVALWLMWVITLGPAQYRDLIL